MIDFKKKDDVGPNKQFKQQFAKFMTTKQKGDQKMLHVLSEFVNMRFTLVNNKAYLSQKARKNKRITEQQNNSSRQSSVTNSPTKEEKTPKPSTLLKLQALKPSSSTANNQETEEAHFRIKFLERLSDEHLIIGNQYQMDMLKIGGSIDGFLDIEHKWSVNPQDVVHTYSVQRKFSLIAIASKNRVWIYRYDLKKDNEHPNIIVDCCHTSQDEQIIQVRFIRNAGIYIIFKKKIEYYMFTWVCEKAELNKCFTYSLKTNPNMSIFSVPQACDNTLNIYFYQKRVQQQKFNLWMQSFVSYARLDTPQVGKMIRIYSLEEQVRDKIEIFNYNSEICLIQFQNKLIAFKNGFVIDAVSTNIHQPSYFIKYVSSQKTLFHFLDNVIDIYTLSMIEKSKPEKFRLICRDCIEFTYKTSGKLLSILHLGKDSFAFFFETSDSRSSSNNPNITYRFAITQPVTLRAKLDQIYPSPQDMSKLSLEDLYLKSNIAQKMGLSKRDAFLELWLRSSKTTITDFQILLSTRDFPTIQAQIQHKLKHQSMSVRELLKIYGQCLTMLYERVFSQSCKYGDLQEYTICHFLIRKLDMLRWILSQQIIHEGAILINIKDYYEYKDLSIITAIVDLVCEFLNHPSGQILLKLRGIFKFFRLICKVEYQQILSRIICKCKLRVLQILKVLPELLPYECKQDEISIGLWKPLEEQQLDQNLFLSQMVTIDNRQRVQQFPKNIWFKRYQYSNHGVIKDVDRNAVATYLAQKNNSESMFYMFLCKVYQLNIFNKQLRQLITYTQQKYDLMPEHLRGKLELYFIMYSIFTEIDKSLNLYNFLKMRQHELFKLYFERQKVEKGGFILKKIKPLYEQLLSKGKQTFNQGMFDYFSSQQSTVSDLKCILSKLNNQKNEFHISSEQLYEVLINAIMQKIKVGSSNDTPIDEILVYIENIPFPIHNECIMSNLEYIQEINFESEMLRRIRVDMTLAQIVKNGEKVIQMMVDHEIQRHQMHRIRDYRSLRLHAYKILAQIQCRKSNIYGQQFHSYSLKIFLINVMSKNQMIPLCKQLLADKYLIQEFQIDDAFKQSVVMHLYQWRLSLKQQTKNPYKNHLIFINLLIDLLDKSNSKRQFIEASMRYANLFTLPSFQIQYPLFPTFKYYPSLVDIEALMDNLSADDLPRLQLQKVFDVMVELKKLGQAEMNATFFIDGYENKLRLQLYEIYLVRLIEERQLRLALKIAQILLEIPNQFSSLSFVYPILIIERTYEQVLQNTANLLNRLISYSFNNPKQLCNTLSKIYSNSQKYSNQKLDKFLKQQLEKKQNERQFSPNNDIFQDWIKKSNEIVKCNQILEICLQRILKVNQVYRKNHSMQVIFRLMCHEPLAMAKWIWCKGSGINMKTVRSFISYMSIEILFDADSILKAAIQAFQVLRFKYTNNVFFSQILKYRSLLSSKAEKYEESQNKQDKDEKAIKLINQTIQLLQHKRQTAQREDIPILQEKSKIDYNMFLKDPNTYLMRGANQYIYSDKDDAYEDMNDELSIKSKWRSNYGSNPGKISQKNSLKIYEEIPLPTAVRRRKNSEYFPEMLDIQENFVEKILKASFSATNLSNFPQGKSHFPIEQILEDDRQNMNSMMLIKHESNCEEDSPKIMKKLKQSDSIFMEGFEHEEESFHEQQLEFKIAVRDENDNQPAECQTNVYVYKIKD